MKYSPVFYLLMICVFGTKAQTSTWDGEANDGVWESKENWSGDVLPCTTCDVVIADGYVELSTNVTVKSVNLSTTGTLTQLNINTGPTLTIANPSSFGLIMKPGTLLKVDGTLFFGPNINKDHILNDGATILVQGLIYGDGTVGNAYSAENGSKLYVDGIVDFKNFEDGIRLTTANDTLIVHKTLLLEKGETGIMSSGVVINNDSIYIQNMTQRGIDSDGFIQNNYNADLYIEDVTNEAMVLNNQSLTFLNYGDIIISNTGDIALKSDRNISNFGTISTDNGSIEVSGKTFNNYLNVNLNNVGPTGITLKDSSRLNNYGEIQIDNRVTGINVEDTLSRIINDGDLIISDGNVGISTYGNVTNKDSTYLNEINANSIILRGPAIFHNELLGKVRIDNSNSGIMTVEVFGKYPYFQNEGDVFIDNSISGIGLNGGGENEGTIVVQNCSNVGLRVYKEFMNSGEIDITHIDGQGLDIRAIFTQNGTLNIQTAGTSIIGNSILLVKEKLINTGSIHLQSTNNTGAAIWMTSESAISGDTTQFYNSGEVIIESGFGGSIRTQLKTSIVNDKKIELNNGITNYGLDIINNDSLIFQGPDGIIILGSSLNSKSSFTNNGFLEMQQGTNHIDINGKSTFTNEATGIMYANDFDFNLKDSSKFINKSCIPLRNVILDISDDALVLNSGMLSAGPSDDPSFLASVKNSGIFHATADNFIGKAEFVNDGIAFTNIYGQLSDDIKELPILFKGASPDFSISTNFWTDKAKTSVAGTYDNADQSLTPKAISLTADTLYFEATKSPSCIVLMPIAVINDTCRLYNQSDLTFTGINSNNWHDPENWDLGSVPCNCNNVIIPSGKVAEAVVGAKVRSRGMEAENGAVLTIPTGSVADFRLDYIFEVEEENED